MKNWHIPQLSSSCLDLKGGSATHVCINDEQKLVFVTTDRLEAFVCEGDDSQAAEVRSSVEDVVCHPSHPASTLRTRRLRPKGVAVAYRGNKQ